MPVQSTNKSDVRAQFSYHLTRAYDKGTHESGAQGCLQMLNQLAPQLEAANSILKAMTDVNAVKIAKEQLGVPKNPVAYKFHASLFGMMA
jgi:hypothetical protein